MSEIKRNWAGNIAYRTDTVRTPATVAELQDAVRGAKKLRALGSRHSFNTISDTDGELISLRGLNRVIAIDKAAQTVTVEGGITYGELGPVLDAAGFALHNLASLPHISVVGACATSTHGSGSANRNLAAAIVALDFVTASGDIVRIARGDAGFDGAVVHLGALGVVARATLKLEPRFDVRQTVYVDLPFASYADNFDAIADSAYSVSAFTPWRGDIVPFIWLKARADAASPPASLFGAAAAARPWHPIPSIDPAPCTEQMGVPGPWHLRLPHFRMEFQPSAGAELQSEYFVARRDAAAALRALHAAQDKIAPPLMVSEVRTMAGDDLWLSHNYRQDSVAFHFTWVQDWPAVSQALGAIEAALAPFAPRPHWGKLFTMDRATLQSRYPRLGDFRALAQKHDPHGKFRNDFLDQYVF